jgi:alkylhydroperoxidase family enzyme
MDDADDPRDLEGHVDDPDHSSARAATVVPRYATSVENDGRMSMTYRAEALRQLGMTNEQIFEATSVISVYAKNRAFSTGLQLEPTQQ